MASRSSNSFDFVNEGNGIHANALDNDQPLNFEEWGASSEIVPSSNGALRNQSNPNGMHGKQRASLGISNAPVVVTYDSTVCPRSSVLFHQSSPLLIDPPPPSAYMQSSSSDSLMVWTSGSDSSFRSLALLPTPQSVKQTQNELLVNFDPHNMTQTNHPASQPLPDFSSAFGINSGIAQVLSPSNCGNVDGKTIGKTISAPDYNLFSLGDSGNILGSGMNLEADQVFLPNRCENNVDGKTLGKILSPPDYNLHSLDEVGNLLTPEISAIPSINLQGNSSKSHDDLGINWSNPLNSLGMVKPVVSNYYGPFSSALVKAIQTNSNADHSVQKMQNPLNLLVPSPPTSPSLGVGEGSIQSGQNNGSSLHVVGNPAPLAICEIPNVTQLGKSSKTPDELGELNLSSQLDSLCKIGASLQIEDSSDQYNLLASALLKARGTDINADLRLCLEMQNILHQSISKPSMISSGGISEGSIQHDQPSVQGSINRNQNYCEGAISGAIAAVSGDAFGNYSTVGTKERDVDVNRVIGKGDNEPQQINEQGQSQVEDLVKDEAYRNHRNRKNLSVKRKSEARKVEQLEVNERLAYLELERKQLIKEIVELMQVIAHYKKILASPELDMADVNNQPAIVNVVRPQENKEQL